MKKNYVEFYFPGTNLGGQNEREVSLKAIEAIKSIPTNAISCRFFSKDENGNKVDFSPYYFFGLEYTAQEFKTKFPQLASDPTFANAKRIVKAETGGFYPLKDEDFFIPFI